MSSLPLSAIFFGIFLCFSTVSLAQEPFYPPPSDIEYQNDTLTIFPPDSLPGDPVILLGYNIYVDSTFFTNIYVDNQDDTAEYIFNTDELYPGNHEFCAKALYNEWISDQVCDSGLVIYGYELPFLEDWSSGNFSQNEWKTDSGNWTVEAEEGNPGPAAVFSGLPAQYNYEIPLESYAFRGDSLHFGNLFLGFDVKLISNTNTGNERLVIQRYNWNNQLWEDVDYFSNHNGSFDWSRVRVKLFGINKTGPDFKVRIVARGLNSSDISYWAIDNLYIYRDCWNATDLVLYESSGFNTVYWTPPIIGCGPWWFHWDDGVNSGNSIGTGDSAEFSVAARWDPDQLIELNGVPIVRISFFPAEVQAEYSIRIWTGDSTVHLIYDKPVPNPVIGQWNDITVDSSIYIDATKELYVGYHINAYAGYPAGVDDGPAINGYGNMIYWEDTWQTLLEVNQDLDYNWNIQFSDGPDPDFPDARYKIYRNTNDEGYQLYDIVDYIPYEDHNINEDDFYCYEVTMEWNKYRDTCESVPTNEDCSTIFGLNENSKDEFIRIYPNPASSSITIQSSEPMERIKIYSLLGDLVLEKNVGEKQIIVDVSSIKSGVYFLEIKQGKNKSWKKIIKN
jgi:hypothetical protein